MLILPDQEKNNSLIYTTSSSSFFYANNIKIYQFRAKNSEINAYPLYLRKISKDCTVDNMIKKLIKRTHVRFFH